MGKIAKQAEAKSTSERELIIEALNQAGSVHGAALLLGIYPQAVNNFMRKYKLSLKREVVAQVIEG